MQQRASRPQRQPSSRPCATLAGARGRARRLALYGTRHARARAQVRARGLWLPAPLADRALVARRGGRGPPGHAGALGGGGGRLRRHRGRVGSGPQGGERGGVRAGLPGSRARSHARQRCGPPASRTCEHSGAGREGCRAARPRPAGGERRGCCCALIGSDTIAYPNLEACGACRQRGGRARPALQHVHLVRRADMLRAGHPQPHAARLLAQVLGGAHRARGAARLAQAGVAMHGPQTVPRLCERRHKPGLVVARAG